LVLLIDRARAKAIKNKPKINEDLDQKALLQKYEMVRVFIRATK
jgi:hypothetical protein